MLIYGTKEGFLPHQNASMKQWRNGTRFLFALSNIYWDRDISQKKPWSSLSLHLMSGEKPTFEKRPPLWVPMTTRKTIALTGLTFVDQVMSLFFNMLSGLVIAFLPRSKCLLISWQQSPSAVILEPLQIKSQHFHCFPIYLPWSDRTGCRDLSFLNVELYANLFTLLFHFQEAL